MKDTMLVSFAGPATNFLLSIGFAVLLRLLIEFFPLGEWQGNTVWDFFFLMFQTGVVAVSYTHLDVYKRQRSAPSASSAAICS